MTQIEKRTIELEYNIPEGWRSLGRPPKNGEYYVLPKVYSEFYMNKHESVEPAKPIYLAVEKVKPFVWPEWLLCDWIAKDASDDWYGWNGDAPIIVPNRRVWYPDGFYLDPAIVDTSAFPQCNWERSLFGRTGKGD